MKNGRFVLQNSKGEVVRVVHVSGAHLKVIKRHDTQRLEIHSNTEHLEQQKTPFSLIVEVKSTDIQTTPLKIGNLQLLHTDRADKLAPNVQPAPDDENTYKSILKWSTIVQAIALALILITGFIIKAYFSEPEPTVVTVNLQKPPVPIKNTVKPVKKQTVKPSKYAAKKVTPKRKAVKKVYKKKAVAKSINRRSRGRSTSVQQLGALGALGGAKNGSRGSAGNLNLNKVNGSIGKNSGFAAQGSAFKASYGKGLVRGQPGKGTQIDPSGDYITRGKAGGRAGYGNMSLAGSHASYLTPLQEEALIDGGLSRDQIAAVIQRHLGQVLYCYEQGLQRDPSLSGKVAMRFIIGGSGRVQTAKVQHSSLGSRPVEGCIANKLRSWKFPQPYGNVNVKVTYPFVLKRVSQKG